MVGYMMLRSGDIKSGCIGRWKLRFKELFWCAEEVFLSSTAVKFVIAKRYSWIGDIDFCKMAMDVKGKCMIFGHGLPNFVVMLTKLSHDQIDY